MSDDTKKHSEFEQQLPVKLTQDELLKRGAQLAQLHSDFAQHNAHATSVKNDLKAKETMLEAETSRVAGIVRTGHEPRPVVVQRWHDFKRNVAYDMRTDTGEIFGERALSPDERQGELLPSAEEPAAKKRRLTTTEA